MVFLINCVVLLDLLNFCGARLSFVCSFATGFFLIPFCGPCTFPSSSSPVALDGAAAMANLAGRFGEPSSHPVYIQINEIHTVNSS